MSTRVFLPLYCLAALCLGYLVVQVLAQLLGPQMQVLALGCVDQVFNAFVGTGIKR